MKTRPGEIWQADLGITGKVRPVVVISRNDNDPPRDLIIYVPCTTKSRSSKYEVELGKIGRNQEVTYVNVQGIGSVSSFRLEKKLGSVSENKLLEIHEAIKFALQMF